jgi:sulfur carrier protein ThiS
MIVHLRLYGTLRRFSLPESPGRWSGEVPEGATIEALLQQLGIPPTEVAGASIDDHLRPMDWEIESGSVITLVTPVGGG